MHAVFPDINAACTHFSRLMAKMRKSSKWIRQFVSLYHYKVDQSSVCFVKYVSNAVAADSAAQTEQQHGTVGIPDTPQTFQIRRPNVMS